MTTYVHAPGIPNVYHWCSNCSEYPGNPQGPRMDRPEDNLCDQCKAKEKNGDCRGQLGGADLSA